MLNIRNGLEGGLELLLRRGGLGRGRTRRVGGGGPARQKKKEVMISIVDDLKQGWKDYSQK